VKLLVSFKRLSITLILFGTLVGTLVGCTINSTQPNYDLDSHILMRSAIFTQRELINSLLDDPAGTPSANSAALLNSYCDLVKRKVIYISTDNLPQQCSDRAINHQTLSCAKKFHECTTLCSLRTDSCQSCTSRAKKCLD